MDDHQRWAWGEILSRLTDFENRVIDLGLLVKDLRGLYVEADPHDVAIRNGFESHWILLDAEHELRAESWAPAGAACDDRLTDAIGSFRSWVNGITAFDTTTEHR